MQKEENERLTQRKRRVGKNGVKGGSERDGRRTMIRAGARGRGGGKGELRDERDKRGARGFGLARSTRYPFSACVSPESSLPVLASIRTSPSPLFRPAVRCARAHSTPSRCFPHSTPHDLTAWRAMIAIAKPPLSCRLVPLPYLRSPTRRQDGGASQRASLRSRHGDVTLSSVVQ